MAKTISSLNVVLNGVVGPFVKSFSQAGSSAQQFFNIIQQGSRINVNMAQSMNAGNAATRGWSLGFSSLGSMILKATIYSAAFQAVWSAIKTASGGLKLASEIEQTGIALETMLGSADQARQLLDDLKRFAFTTPFTFADVAPAAKQLIAYGSAAGDVEHELNVLGDIASGLNIPLGEIVQAYGHIRAQQRAYSIDLRRFSMRGIPILAALADTMGVDKSEIYGLAKAGQIGFGDIRRALESLTGESGRFHNMMARQSQTMAGLWSNLADNIGFAFSSILLKMVDLFGLRDVMRALIRGTGEIRAQIEFFLDHYGQLVVDGMKFVYNGFVAGWDAVVSYIRPIVISLVGFLRNNFMVWVTENMQLWLSVAEFLMAVWDTISTGLKVVAAELVAAWDAAMEALGLETWNAGLKQMTIGQMIVAAWKWVVDNLELLFNAMTFTVKNWHLAFEIAGLYVISAILNVWDHISNFGDNVEIFLNWMMQNWTTVFSTIANYVVTTFTNMAKNLVSIITNLPDLISGKTDWSKVWVPLEKGFHSALVNSPAFKDFQKSPFAAAVDAALAVDQTEFARGLQASLTAQKVAQEGTVADTIGAVQGAVEKIKALWAAATNQEIPKPPHIDLPKSADDEGTKKPMKAGKEAKKEAKNELIRAGSAMAQRLRFEGAQGRGQDTASLLDRGNKLAEEGNKHLEDIGESLDDFTPMPDVAEADL